LNISYLVGMDERGRQRLKANACTHCDITFFPRRDICTNCFSEEFLQDQFLAEEGILHAFTTVYRSLPQFKTPYVIGYVDIPANNVRVFGQIETSSPEDLKVGMPMKIEIIETDEGKGYKLKIKGDLN